MLKPTDKLYIKGFKIYRSQIIIGQWNNQYKYWSNKKILNNVKQNNYEIQFNYDENGDNFEKIKKENIELFKIQKQKNKIDLAYLLKKLLGQNPWLKLTSLMQKLTSQSNSGKHIMKL